MISFRYHLVTIVAVFLALGLGVLAGTTVVDEGLVSRLKDQTQSANLRAEGLQEDRDRLEAELGRSEELGAALAPEIERGRLLGTSAVVVAYEGTDPAALDQAEGALRNAGADVASTLTVTRRMGQPDDAARRDLAAIVGEPVSTPSGPLSTAAAAALAERLADGAPVAGDDVLVQMLEGGFLEAPDRLDPAEVGGGGQAVVVAAGGQGEPPVPPGTFLVPLVRDLARGRTEVVAGESTESVYEFVPMLRADEELAGAPVVTVDDLDETAGGAALVLGLQDLLRTGEGGDFGVKRGAEALLPAIPPPSE